MDKTLAIVENYEIRSNTVGGYVLYNQTSRHSYYFSELDQIFRELLDLKIAELAGKDQRRNLESLGESIELAKEWIKNVVQKALKV